jgi:hypothetical protein
VEDTKKGEPTPRSVGFGLLIVALLIFGANEFMLRVFNRYFPIILALIGPFISMGLVGMIYPRTLDALFAGENAGHPKWLRYLSRACLVVGVLLSIFILLKVNYG